MNRMVPRGLALGCVAAVLSYHSSAVALERCRVKVAPATGVIQVFAKDVGAGPLRWGSVAGAETSSFFEPACVANGKATKCLLADPATLAAKTPPTGCTLHLADGVDSCSTWIPGCVPGSRTALDLASTIVGAWLLHQGGTITFNADGTFATSELTTGTYEVVGNSVLLDIDSIPEDLNSVLTYLGTRPSGQLVFSQETALGLSPGP